MPSMHKRIELSRRADKAPEMFLRLVYSFKLHEACACDAVDGLAGRIRNQVDMKGFCHSLHRQKEKRG